jgi:hypothetical protein
MTREKRTPKARDVVTLADLAPRHDVTGGSQRRVFGADPIVPPGPDRRPDMKSAKTAARKPKDLPAKSNLKGGGHNLNDNITLRRSARRVKRAADLTPKSPSRVRGGTGTGHEDKLAANDSLTLVRAAR